jgi:hypothetical protein
MLSSRLRQGFNEIHIRCLAKKNMHSKILKRAGIVLIIIGVLDIAYMIWCVRNGHSYSSSFNIFAVIGGVFLVRGSLKAARWISMLLSFALGASLCAVVAIPFMLPLGYWLAVFRNDGIGATLGVLFAVGMVVLLYWLRRELQSPEVVRAQVEAGVPRAKIVQPIVAGIVLVVAVVVFLTLLLRGGTAREAIRRAEQQFGGNYHYVVTNLQIQSNMRERSVFAVLDAYNDSELKTVQVRWTE